MKHTAFALAAIVAALALAGCGGSGDEAEPAGGAPAAGAAIPGGGLTIAEAVASTAEGPLLVKGYVVEVGWRSTKIRTLPNNIVVIPNQKLAQSILTNYHMPEQRMSLLIPISVSYEADPDHVERVLTQVATKSSDEIDGLLSDPPPFVRFIPGFGAYSLDFTLICQVAEFTEQYAVQHELRKRIFRRLREEGIEIPFPIQTIRFDERPKEILAEGIVATTRAHTPLRGTISE